MKHICEQCYEVQKAKKKVKGGLGLEIILWLCGIIPGLIYSIWRAGSRRLVCKSCGSERIIRLDSVKGKMLLKQIEEIK